MRSAKLVSLELEEERRQSGRKPSTANLSEGLRRILARSIEEALDSLGGNVGQVILYHIEKKYSLKMDDMIDSPESFLEALQDIFGLGAFTLEQIVVENVLRNIPVPRDEVHTRRFCRLITGLRRKAKLCSALGE